MNNTVKVVLVLLVLIFVALPVTLKVLAVKGVSEATNVAPDWNRPFVNDTAVVGTWESVDHVRAIDDFKPGQKGSSGDLFLKSLTFKPDGTTSGAWNWTKGYMWYPNDHAEGQYTIRVVDGTKYLFMEWISGDVLIRNEKPWYYVMKPKD